MKLDLLYEVDVPRPWAKPHPWGQREGEQAAYREALEQIRLADEMAFNTVWCVEHHFREGRSHSPAPEVLIGALTQITEQIRLGFGVVLMPFGFTHPARVAEKVATADILSGGRVEWGTGRSTPMEQLAFGVDREHTRDQWKEAIEIVCGMWESEYFEYESATFRFPRRLVTPKPVQDPHPPAWMAGTSPGSSALAGQYGLGLLSLSIMQPLERLVERITDYRKAAENPTPLTRVTTNKVAAYTLVHCSDSMAQAEEDGIWDSVWWWYKNLAEFTLEWEFAHFSQADKDRLFPLLKHQASDDFNPKDFNDADMIIVGDPDQCMEKMLRYADLGVDQLICYVQFGYLPHESVKRTIELLGKHVIPELERRGVQASVQPVPTGTSGDGPPDLSQVVD